MYYFEILGDIFYYFIFILLIPLGTYILIKTNVVEEKFMNFARKNTEGRRVEYIQIFGKTIKTESPKGWNIVTLRIMGGTMILMGTVVLIVAVFNIINL
jgi:hypothetical protein